MWARMCSSYLLGSDVGPLWSQGWEETPISIGIGCEIRNFWKGWRKYAVRSPVTSDIETGIDWNRMRPEEKALLGKSWKGGNSMATFLYISLSLTLTGVSVVLRCQTIIVARIRGNFCQRRMWNSETWEGGKYASIIYLLLLYPYLWELNG